MTTHTTTTPMITSYEPYTLASYASAQADYIARFADDLGIDDFTKSWTLRPAGTGAVIVEQNTLELQQGYEIGRFWEAKNFRQIQAQVGGNFDLVRIPDAIQLEYNALALVDIYVDDEFLLKIDSQAAARAAVNMPASELTYWLTKLARPSYRMDEHPMIFGPVALVFTAPELLHELTDSL